jgi:hypothetical protein
MDEQMLQKKGKQTPSFSQFLVKTNKIKYAHEELKTNMFGLFCENRGRGRSA